MEKEEFVPYSESLEIKELGFDEPCICAFYRDGQTTEPFPTFVVIKDVINSKMSGTIECTRPTFSQTFKFFREKYKLRHSIMDFINDETGIEWDYEIAIIGTDLDERGNYKPLVDYSTNDKNRKFKTYEEAELACLLELINICKKK